MKDSLDLFIIALYVTIGLIFFVIAIIKTLCR